MQNRQGVIYERHLEAIQKSNPAGNRRAPGFHPSEEELAIWKDLWDTWQKLNGLKPKTEKQIRKWLANPYSDSSEYKLWGNSLAVPISYFILAGIAWADEMEAAENRT